MKSFLLKKLDLHFYLHHVTVFKPTGSFVCSRSLASILTRVFLVYVFSNHVQVVCRVICRWFVDSFRFCFQTILSVTFWLFACSGSVFFSSAKGQPGSLFSTLCFRPHHCASFTVRVCWTGHVGLHFIYKCLQARVIVSSLRDARLACVEATTTSSVRDLGHWTIIFVFRIYAFTGVLIEIVITIMSKSQCKLKYGDRVYIIKRFMNDRNAF